MAGQRPEGPSGRASNEEVRAHVEEGSVDIEMQAGGPGASRADLLSHRHPASSAAGGGDGGGGGAANGSAVAQDGSVGSGSGTPPATRTDSKGLQSSEADSEEAAEIKPASYWEITKHFGLLGWTAFGGPAAHVSMFLQVGGASLRHCDKRPLGSCKAVAALMSLLQQRPEQAVIALARAAAARTCCTCRPAPRLHCECNSFALPHLPSSLTPHPCPRPNLLLQLFVEKLHWTTHLVFTELLMLGQCMPGPTSTQMAFAIGVLKKGLSGGLLSGAWGCGSRGECLCDGTGNGCFGDSGDSGALSAY